MADEAKLGTPWQPAELDEIVADYFAMLSAELSGQPYSKSVHSKALMNRIGRTHRSVEFKHQNISAVLDELGLPWIRGYIPKRNYQGRDFRRDRAVPDGFAVDPGPNAGRRPAVRAGFRHLCAGSSA